MNKILIPMFGLLVLPLAAPSSAKFYSGDLQEPEKSEVTQKHFGDLDLHSRSAYEPGNEARPIYRSWQGHNFTDEDKEKDKEKQLATKQAQKTARNSAYGQPTSHGSVGGSSGKPNAGSKGGGSKGEPVSYSKGSKGSKGSKVDKRLSKEKRKRHDSFKKIMRDQQPKGSKGSAGQHDGKPAQYEPKHWDMSKFKHFDKDHWSEDDFDKAMLCWLAPHMHEDKEFVNRYWNKWGYKWKWLHKYYKHKFHKHKHDKPSEVPLPASSLLFGCALLGLATIGQRRRRH